MQTTDPNGSGTVALTVNRTGTLMEFSDGGSFYVKIDFANYKTTVPFETAAGRYELKRENSSGLEWVLTDATGKKLVGLDIGRARKTLSVKFENGFQADLNINGAFLYTGTWTNAANEFLVSVARKWWNFKKPFTVTIDPGLASAKPELLLLAVIGIRLLEVHRN